MTASLSGMRKVRAPQGKALDNVQQARASGKCHRKIPLSFESKGEKVGQEPTGHWATNEPGKPRLEQDQIGRDEVAR